MTTDVEVAQDELDRTRDHRLLSAVDELMPVLYAELRRTARRERRRVSAGDTLATTALVNETYARLSGNAGFEDRGHFLRVSAIAMRRILIERVRAQLTQKRGGDYARVPIEEAEEIQVEDDERIALVDEALQRLALQSTRLAEIVECRFFAGYSEKETAEALGISERTVQRDWATARAWLQREIDRGG